MTQFPWEMKEFKISIRFIPAASTGGIRLLIIAALNGLRTGRFIDTSGFVHVATDPRIELGSGSGGTSRKHHSVATDDAD